MNVEERRVEVQGLPTRYLAAGEGPPLVLLHALGESALDWRWVLPALTRTYSVYAPDLPGFGDSAKPLVDYSPTFFARFISGYLDALGLERAAVAGNSLGGLVALRLALSEPERVSALGLIDSARRAYSYLRPAGADPARVRRADDSLEQNAARRNPTGLDADTSSLRAPRLCPSRVDKRAVPTGATTGLSRGGAGRAARSGRPQRTARGAIGPALWSGDAYARGLGSLRSGIPRIPGTRGHRPPQRGLPRAYTCLRSPAPRRAP